MTEKNNLIFLKDNLNLKSLRLLLGLLYDGQHDAPDLLKVLKDMTGELTSAVMLQQVIQWDARMRDRRDGWWYKSKPSWLDQAGLSRHQIDRAEPRLKACGVMRKLAKPTDHAGKSLWPAKVKHYKLHVFRFWRMFARALGITWEKLVELMDAVVKKIASLEADSTSRKAAGHPDDNRQDILPESGSISGSEAAGHPPADSQDSNRTTTVLSSAVATEEQPPLPAPAEAAAPMQQNLQITVPVVVVESNHSEIFRKAMDQIKIQIGENNFDTWLRDGKLIACEPPPPGSAAPPSPVYVVGVKSEFAVDCCQNRMYRTIRRIMSDVAGKPVELRFEIAEPPKPKLPDHPALKDLIEVDTPPVEPFEALRVARQAEVERLYTAYIGQPAKTKQDRAGLRVIAGQHPVGKIEEGLKNMQFQGSRQRINDPVGYLAGILGRMP